MILVLSFFILIFFLLGFIFSKIKINIKKLNFEMSRRQMNQSDYKINIGIYLYGKIKILGITCYGDNINIMNKKIKIQNIKDSKIYERIIKSDVSNVDRKEIINNLKNLNFKFEKFNLDLSLGTDSTLITSFLIFAVSTIISIIIKKGVTKYNPKKHSFIITPKYENYNLIKLDLSCVLSCKVLNIIKMITYINKANKENIKLNQNNLVNKKKHYPGYV